MSAGLEASTVTPGSTAPELSRTTPAIEPDCPCALMRATPSVSRTRDVAVKMATLSYVKDMPCLLIGVPVGSISLPDGLRARILQQLTRPCQQFLKAYR